MRNSTQPKCLPRCRLVVLLMSKQSSRRGWRQFILAACLPVPSSPCAHASPARMDTGSADEIILRNYSQSMRGRSFNFTTKNKHGARERHIHFHPACVAGAGERRGGEGPSTPFLPCLARAHVLEFLPSPSQHRRLKRRLLPPSLRERQLYLLRLTCIIVIL